MGKGQLLRRQQTELPSTTPPLPPSSGLLSGIPPTPRVAAPAFNIKPKVHSKLQSADGMNAFLNNDGAGRLTAVDQLLQSAGKSNESGSMKSSKSMQSLADGLNNANISTGGLNPNASSWMKKSNSFEDMGIANGSKENTADITSDLSAIVERCGLYSPEGLRIISVMSEQIKTSGSAEGGLSVMQALLRILGRAMEPFVLPLLTTILLLNTDRSTSTRELATAVGCQFAEIACPQGFKLIWNLIATSISEANDWRVKVAAMQMLIILAPRASVQLSPLLPQIIPLVSECAIDPKKQVQTVAVEALNIACKSITNEDIAPIVTQLISVIAFPDEAPKTIDLLLETTFVSNVDSPTLALIAPLLGKALRGRSSVLKRKAARIIDNMCRLVQEPSDVAPFVPMLLPVLNKVIDEIADAEVCDVAKVARATLQHAMGEGKAQKALPAVHPGLKVDIVEKNMYNDIISVLAPICALKYEEEEAVVKGFTSVMEQVSGYSSQMLAYLLVDHTDKHAQSQDAECTKENAYKYAVAMSSSSSFNDCVVPYIKVLMQNHKDYANSAPLLSDGNVDVETQSDNLTELAQQVALEIRKVSLGNLVDVEANEDVDTKFVCNIEFSLAFGGKILLHNAKLKLGRGRRYGIMGKNGAGKTTLMKNIASHNIEGFPEALRTVYVQHDDSAMPDLGLSLIDELVAAPALQAVGVTLEQARDALLSINFTESMLQGFRTALSGGWKMKLAIIRAMLAKADILLLDEPTNHLDAASVRWLATYLQGLTDVTCLIVTHDTDFMDHVVTDIIHYETRKLVYYHGSLKDFVKIHPEAKYYYELSSSNMKFVFPTPERLEGIASTTRTILKMENVTFTYPGASKPSIINASVKLCLGSRVAVLGPNGAGKSTLIKLLVQETQPDGFDKKGQEGAANCGEIWKHHNLRVAYVAQHSFHHIEQHLDITPVDYIKWRFDGGVDREDMNKASMKLTEEEETDSRQKKYGDVDKVVGRRKNGRVMEYECTWIGQGYGIQTPAMKKRNIAAQMEANKYIPLDEMIAMGLQKLVQQTDTRIAATAAGLDLRPLITREIQGHLDDFNLDAEFATHGNIVRLSGGQKVKLVLAAAMWNRPHVIVLDEPTNYLDREALGALTEAIKAFNGGVVIISHHSDFTDALCTEKWFVDSGIVTTEGEAEETKIYDNKVFKKQIEESVQIAAATDVSGAKSGNTNKTKESLEQVKNPKTFEYLTKVEVRKFSKLAAIAGLSLKDYVGKITKDSPEWKMLSSTVNC